MYIRPGAEPDRPATIVGAGPAGEAVSEVLAAAGVAHDIYDEAPRSGGNITRRRFDAPASAIESRGDVRRFIGGAAVLAVTPDRLVEFARGAGVEQRGYDVVFICSGAYDLQLPSRGRPANWSSAGALQALLKGQGIVPQGRIVLAGAGPFLHIVGADLTHAGAAVADIVDAVPLVDYAGLLAPALGQPGTIAQFLRAQVALLRAGTRLHFGTPMMTADARAATLADGRVLPFDWLGVSDAFAPQTQLARTAGCRQAYSSRGRYFFTATDACGRGDRPGIFICGEGQGVRGALHARKSGRIAACAWLQDTGRALPNRLSLASLGRQRDRFVRLAEKLETIIYRRPRPITDESWICACERVPASRVREAIAAGLADLSSIKIVTRCGMGNCQGRYCEPLICRLFEEAGKTPAAPLTQKALVRPVLAAELADG